MAELPWNIGIMEWFVANRVDWLTNIFLFFTFLGNELGYILLVVFIYWLFDKQIAIRVVMAVILTFLINHTLKILIRNPRPFIKEGTYEENWAIAEGDVEDTVNSFSTPSGHAQSSSTFWWYLHLKTKSRLTFILLFPMILLVGISRTYLGVHFLEDVVIGWFVGFLVVILIHRYDDRIATWWHSLSNRTQYIICITIPLIVMVVAGILSDYGPDGELYVTLGGLFTGISVGIILDRNYLNFTSSLNVYSNVFTKIGIGIARFGIGIIVVIGVLLGLDELFSQISSDDTLLGFILRWIRYTSVGLIATFVAPAIFVKLKLAPNTENI